MSVNLSQQDYELLSAYIDGELSDAERLGLEIRLDAETDLRRELESLRQTVALVDQLPRLKAPRNFTLTVTPQKVVRKLPLLLTSTFSGLSAAAAVLLLMFGGYLLLGSNRQISMTSQFAREVAVQSTVVADVVSLPAQSTLAAPLPTQTELPQGGMFNTAPAANSGGAAGEDSDSAQQAAPIMPAEEFEQATEDEAAMLDTFSMEMATEEPADSAGASVMQEADDEQITLEALLYATDANVIAAAPMVIPTQAAADITAQRNVIEPTATALATATNAAETTKLPEAPTLDSGTVGLVIVGVGAALLLIALATTLARRNARI